MASGQATQTETDGRVIPVAVTINDAEIDATSLTDLYLTREIFEEARNEVKKEIDIHLSDPQEDKTFLRERATQIPVSKKGYITVNFQKDQLTADKELFEEVNSLTSPFFSRMFNSHALGWVVRIAENNWVDPLAAIIPAALFALLSSLILYTAGTSSTWATLATLALGGFLVFLGFVILRLFTEARRFRVQTKIERKHKSAN
jgi:hypothetical protein